MVMVEDKDKIGKAFNGTNGSELIFKISDNFNDSESIKQVFELME